MGDREQLIEAGLVKLPEGGGGPRDYFFNRVTFPITDRRGQVIAFGGRILSDGQPKYLNSPETALFHKGRVLYNWARAREAARDAGTVVVAVSMPHPGRPVHDYLVFRGGGRVHDGIRERLLRLEGIDQVVVEPTWNPPWSPARATTAGRRVLGLS